MGKNLTNMHVKIHPAWVEVAAFVYSDPACVMDAVRELLKISSARLTSEDKDGK